MIKYNIKVIILTISKYVSQELESMLIFVQKKDLGFFLLVKLKLCSPHDPWQPTFCFFCGADNSRYLTNKIRVGVCVLYICIVNVCELW